MRITCSDPTAVLEYHSVKHVRGPSRAMNGSQVVPLHLDEAFANSKLLERLGRQDERWIIVVPRGWRTQDEMTSSQSGSQWAGYDSALADQANSARLCSSGWPRPPMVDLVWLVLLSPFSGCGLGLAGSGCQICHDDEDSMRSCRRTLRGRSVGGRRCAPPRPPLPLTVRYS